MAGAAPSPVGPEISEHGNGRVRRHWHWHGHDAHAPHRIPPGAGSRCSAGPGGTSSTTG